ncbi:hypothetical protein Bpfe_014464 [Biomphalaria pfeifferi]|uniref:Uncharacterized protein n=1 Tax=Biomphalaria pfeifferi TaxID=112525 RepID=A0AAD8BL39_BIOPF|nr:hypothetical protein Bpfe_014464 [Biomphalaria pfeifferi]
MGSQDSVIGPYGHTFFFPDIMGSQNSVTSRIVNVDTISFSEIMGSQYSVLGPLAHTFSYPVIMGSQDSVTSRIVNGDTISFS